MPLTPYKDLLVRESSTGEAGIALTDNFKSIADDLETLASDVAALQVVDSSHGTRLDDLESSDTAADVRFGQIESAASVLSGRVTSAESDIDSLQSVDTSLDGRIGTLEGSSASHATRLDSLEASAVLSLLDFNVDPTGSADSTAGIQAAIDAAVSGGYALYAPAGTYKVLAPRVLKKGLKLFGAGYNTVFFIPAGTTFGTQDQFIAANEGIFMTQVGVDSSYITLDNFRLKGHRDPNLAAGSLETIRSSGLCINASAEYCTITRIWSHDNKRQGILCKGSYNHFSHIWCWENNSAGFSVGDYNQAISTPTKNVTLNQIRCWGSTAKAGIEVKDLCDGITISNFSCYNNYQHQLTITSHSTGLNCRNINYVNGVIDANDASNGFGALINSGEVGTTHEGITYQNVMVKACATGFSIPGPTKSVSIIGCRSDTDVKKFAKVYRETSLSPNQDASDVLIANCTADASAAANQVPLIDIGNASNVRVIGCRLKNARTSAIEVTDSSGVRIENNTIIDAGKANSGTRHGINLVAASGMKDLAIIGNRLLKSSGNAVNGINYDSDYNNAIISLNHIRGFTAAIGGDAIPGTALEVNNLTA